MYWPMVLPTIALDITPEYCWHVGGACLHAASRVPAVMCLGSPAHLLYRQVVHYVQERLLSAKLER